MSKAKSIMLQGTASDVGKSILCTALCRIFKEEGYKVAPYKAQNMALNSYVTLDGSEIGRAQGIQAEAAGIVATVEMNPILLKPKQDMESQVIVLGKPYKDMTAREYRANYYYEAIKIVEKSINSLREKYDVLVIEGAGSPAEINLKDREFVNMRTAKIAEAPVILVSDIDRGGVFASIVGTLELLTPEERDRVKGLIINKFRGDISLLKSGIDFIEERTGKPVLGVIPYEHEHGIDQEDSVSLNNQDITGDLRNAKIEIAIIQLPRISNFTDLNILSKIPEVKVRYIKQGQALGNPDVVIIPGTKNTILDLEYLKEQGYAEDIKKLASEGKHIVGICGGYQMLGKMLHDPEGTEAKVGSSEGLGLLDLETTFKGEKSTYQVTGKITASQGSWKSLNGLDLTGYEIHTGVSKLGEKAESLIEFTTRSEEKISIFDGTTSEDGKVFGTHLHGLLDNQEFLLAWINLIREEKNLVPLKKENVKLITKDEIYHSFAEHVRKYLDMEKLRDIMELEYNK